jgi:hypothetical protein
MKIAICTLCINDWYSRIVKYAIKTKGLYAEQNGYDFHIRNEVYDGKRQIMWYKIPSILKILRNYDFVVWFDADGHIMKPDTTIEGLIDKFLPADQDILCTKDWNGVINTGVMIIRNTPFSHKFLQDAWDNKNFPHPEFHEQASMADLITRNVDNCKRKINILDINHQWELFTYWANYWPGRCFFLHVARCAADPGGFMYTLDCYCPIKMDEESEDEFKDRLDWLNDASRCRVDIDGWVNGGHSRRRSHRSKQFNTDLSTGKVVCKNPY